MSFLREYKAKYGKRLSVELNPTRFNYNNLNQKPLTPKKEPNLYVIKTPNDKSDNKFAKTDSNFFDFRINDKQVLHTDSHESISFTINQAEIGIRKFMRKNNEKFINRLIKGPPESFRWISWILAAELPEDRNEELYLNLLKQSLDKKVDTQIKKDLNRTICEDTMFIIDNTQNALYNVLKAYANSDIEVAYCQGMNFIAGFLLIISDFHEIDTLYMMMTLFMFTFGEDNHGLRGFYINEFPLLKLYVFQFESIFNKMMPDLKKHFDDLEVPNELWISKWFQTLFTICIPIDMLVRVWDCIFAKGLDFLFNFSMALLKKHEKNLLSFSDISDISQYFRNMNPSLSKGEECIKFQVEELIASALDIKISKTLLNNLRTEYEKENKVDLSVFKIKYDVKSGDSASKENFEKLSENKNNSNIEHHLNYNLNSMEIKLELNSRFSNNTNNEESKKSTYDVSSINKKHHDIEEHEYSCDTNNSICSEFDLFDNNVIIQNVKAHTFRVDAGKKEEHYKKRSLTTKVNEPAVFKSLIVAGKKK
jgi:hypothetical protein